MDPVVIFYDNVVNDCKPLISNKYSITSPNPFCSS